MKIRALSISGVIAAIFAGWLAVCALLDPKEPSFGGKALSQWLIIHEDSFGPPPLSQAQAQAQRETSQKAILAIGTNAIPTALRWFSKNYDVRDYFHISAFKKGYPLSSMAEIALEILGEQARPAVPDLIQIAESHKNPKTRITALGLLEKVETNSATLVPVFIKCAKTDENADVRHYALDTVVQEIGLDRIAGEELTSALLNDPDKHVRRSAKLFNDDADFFFPDPSDGGVETNDAKNK